jgi:hypothetical protein
MALKSTEKPLRQAPSAGSGRSQEKPWLVYHKPDGSRDKLYEPGWAGESNSEELASLQEALEKDLDLAWWWGWRRGMKRRAVAAIERVAANGDPENRAANVKLVREFSRKAQASHESASPCVKKSDSPSPPRMGRRRVESWESEMLRLARTGLGVHKIAKELQAQYGVKISGPTVSARLRELKGQLSLIS